MPDFDDFWKVYPNQTGIGAAKKSWASEIFFKGAKPEQIIAATKAYAEKHRDTDKKYIPRPSKYLDDQTYLDPDLQVMVGDELKMSQLDGKAALLLASIGQAAYLAWFKNAQWCGNVVKLERDWYAQKIFAVYPAIWKATKELGLTLE